MKKLISLLVVAVLLVCAVCPAAFADGFMYGDLDSGGSVNSGDALIVLQCATGLKTLTDDVVKAADVDGDGKLVASDALYILQFSAGLIEKFPVELKVEEPKDPETKEEILDYYKSVAAENGDIVASQSFDLVDITINRPLLSVAFKSLAKIVLDSNTVDVPGFPGDVENLTADDLTEADFVKNNDGTVTINLKVKSQTDTLEGSKYEGPVGKAIGVVGNIPQVVVDTGVGEFVNVDNATGSLAYKDAFVSVTVDENNKLVKGKCVWQYTVLGDIKGFDINYKPLAISIENGSATGEIDYILAY